MDGRVTRHLVVEELDGVLDEVELEREQLGGVPLIDPCPEQAGKEFLLLLAVHVKVIVSQWFCVRSISRKRGRIDCATVCEHPIMGQPL